MSIVRDNLMTRKDYKPYCGNENCRFNMPRTRYIGGQFQCGCGWRSSFEADFIEAYEAKWTEPAAPKDNVPAVMKELSDTYVSHLEEHDRAMQVGGYVPVDDDYPIEVPLRLCRLAYEATTEGQP